MSKRADHHLDRLRGTGQPAKEDVTGEALFSTLIWRLFLIWTAVGAFVMVAGITPANVGRWFASPDIQAFAVQFLGYADLIWMILAATLVYLRAVAMEGLGPARLAAAIILIGSAIVEWVGAKTGVPFGPYVYTTAFGPRILGVLPIAIPLAWLVILLGGRILVLYFRPQISRVGLSIWVALIALLTDLNLEFVAWKIRGYWVWYPENRNPPAWPPLQNFISWFVIAFLLHFLATRMRTYPSAREKIPRAALVLPVMNALFLLLHAFVNLRR